MARINARSMHYTEIDVEQRLQYASCGHPECPQHAVFWLHPEDHVWNPTSTKGDIYGPARVEFQRFSDGGINVILGGLSS